MTQREGRFRTGDARELLAPGEGELWGQLTDEEKKQSRSTVSRSAGQLGGNDMRSGRAFHRRYLSGVLALGAVLALSLAMGCGGGDGGDEAAPPAATQE